MQGTPATPSPYRLESLLRIPLHELVISAAIDAEGRLRPVGGLAHKLEAYRTAAPAGPFLGCAPAGEVLPSLQGLPAGSRWVQAGEQLEDVLSRLLDVYRLDLAAIREACRERSELTLKGSAAYQQKFDPAFYARRRGLDRQVRALLSGRVAPILFLQAASGQGKTCFLRDLLLRTDRSARVIPLLLRGISQADRQLDLSVTLDAMAEALVGPGDRRGESAVDALDRCLQQNNTRLLVMLDGVNEASDSQAVFNSALRFVQQRLAFGLRVGRSSGFRLIVTSRPERFTQWFSRHFDADELLARLRPISRATAVAVAQLDGLNADELDEALRLARIGPVDGHLRRLLSDPLLLGFYRETVAAMVAAGHPRPATPLGVLQLHWQSQLDALQRLAPLQGLRGQDLVAEVQSVCRKLLAVGDSEARMDWGRDTNVAVMLIETVMVFEETQSGRVSSLQVRFRYDRMAEMLIARHALLRDEEGRPRKPQAVVELIIRTVLRATDAAALGERDVIRGSLVAALQWALENEMRGGAFAIAMELLDDCHAIYAQEAPAIVKACLLSLVEIVHDFLVQSAPWCGPELTDFLSSWFAAHRGDESSTGARLLRRVVFNVLRRNELGCRAPADAQRLKACPAVLHRLGASALLTDASGDPAVLLHALHRDGQPAAAFSILGQSVTQLARKRSFLLRPRRAMRGLQRIGLALQLIAPDAMSEDAFHVCLRDLFAALPAPLVATAAALLADIALHDNDMPVRAEEWAGVGHNVQSFGRMLELLVDEGWEGAVCSEWASVSGIVALAAQSRNGIVAQLLSTALSARIVRADDAARSRLLAELEREIDGLCRADAAADIACPSGGSAYLLSLVCYHLIVFDAPQALQEAGRAHLSRAEALRVFELMQRLADAVLLRPPFLGRFKYRSEVEKCETSNIVGTLGRAALELQQEEQDTTERFRALVRDKARAHAGRDLAFADFLFDSLATLGTLSRDPEPALRCIVETAGELGVSAFAKHSAGPGEQAVRDLDTPLMRIVLKALLQVRTLHPFAVEQFLIDGMGKVDAGPLLQVLRKEAPAELSRHLSWVFENFAERLAIEYPDIVRSLSGDVRANLDLQGLRVVAARSIFRLSAWAKGRDGAAVELLPLASWSARIAGHIGAAGGPLGASLAHARKRRQTASSDTQ